MKALARNEPLAGLGQFDLTAALFFNAGIAAGELGICGQGKHKQEQMDDVDKQDLPWATLISFE